MPVPETDPDGRSASCPRDTGAVRADACMAHFRTTMYECEFSSATVSRDILRERDVAGKGTWPRTRWVA